MNLRRITFYNRFRYSSAYPTYLRLFRPTIYEQYAREVKFYRSILPIPKCLVFDIGANVGDKSAIFSRIVESVIAIEPDSTCYEILIMRFAKSKKVHVCNFAVGEIVENRPFFINNPASPANTLSEKWRNVLQDKDLNRWSKILDFENSVKVQVTTLDNLIRIYGRPYYIKIDVEGFELQVLKGLSQMTRLISLEANFPEFKDETIACIRILNELSNNAGYNVSIDFEFIWETNHDFNFMISWLHKTDLRYFEIFVFETTI